MTKQLILLRHAKSDWESLESSDHARSLHKRGLKDAPNVGQWMGENIEQPDVVLCSTAVRTRETWQLVQSAANWNCCEVEFCSELYMATLDEILRQIDLAFKNHDRILIVAHNPGLDLCLLHFHPDVESTQDHKLMTTSAFAVLEFTDSELENSLLLEFKRPSQL